MAARQKTATIDMVMPSIYDIKPAFQKLLRPVSNGLYNINITPNQVTLFTCICSVIVAVITMLLYQYRSIFWLLPIFFFIRMALNAIDGMLAKEHQLQTKLGAFLNELTDMLSDSALYLPFALIGNQCNYLLIFIIIIFAILTEATGLTAVAVGATRRYDGPMGKSDRAFVFSVVAALIALGVHPGAWLSIVWILIIGLLCYTIVNRIRRAIAEAEHR